MSFLSSALDTGGAAFGVADALGYVAEESPWKTVSHGAEFAGIGLDMVENGANLQNGLALAGAGTQLGLDLAADNGTVGFAESLLPGLGPLAGGIVSTIGGVAQMAQTTDQIDQGYLSNDAGERNEFWGGAGTATLGGAHATLGAIESLAIAADAGEAVSGIGLPLELLSLPATGVALGLDESLAAAEAVTTGIGTATGLVGSALNAVQGLDGEQAHNWGFGANDVVGLGEHLAVDGARWLGSAALGAFGHYAD